MAQYAEALEAIQTRDRDTARRILDAANAAYYADGSSEMTDAEYDEVEALFQQTFGDAVKTGARIDRQAGVPHDWPLLANWLAKVQGGAGAIDWLRSRSAHVSGDGILASPKWDGLSIVITYLRNGYVKRALTRGEDGLGVDVTRLFRGERHFGPDFDAGVVRFGVKYELVMSWGDLDRLNLDLGLELKNPRNAAAGIAATDDCAARRGYVTLVPLDLEYEGMTESRMERLGILSSWFTPDPDAGTAAPFSGNGDRETPFFWYECPADGDVTAAYEEIQGWRSSPEFDFMIDGVVIELPGDDAVKALGGRSSDCPAYAVAAKFPHMVGRSRVVGLDWDLGGTGRLTPCVNYEPVTMDGRTFSRTSIANMTRFDQLRLAPGTPIRIEIRGDVLAWLDRDGPDPEGAVPFPDPEGATFTTNEKGQRVFAYAAEAPLAGRVERMLVKCGVKGIKIETITRLVEHGVVKKLSDMWWVGAYEERIAEIPGLGRSSASSICQAIDRKLKVHLWDWEVLAGLGIEGVGRTLAKEALKVCTLDELLGAFAPADATWADQSFLDQGRALRSERLRDLTASLGPERARLLCSGVADLWGDLVELRHVDSGVLETKRTGGPTYTGPFYKVVVTGDLKRWERDEFKTMIELMGHKMVGSISKHVNFLITNTPNSGTVKNKEALEKGVRIITEEEAIPILGLTVKPDERFDASRGMMVPPREATLDDL